MSRLKVFYILIMTFVGVVFLYRESINIYWAQTYHQESPLVMVEHWLESQMETFVGGDFKPKDAADKSKAVDTKIPSESLDEVSEETPDETTDGTPDEMSDTAADPLQAKSTSLLQTSSLLPGISGLHSLSYPYLDRVFAGPLLPQLPKVLEVSAGDKLFFVGDSLMQGVAPRVRQSLYKSKAIDGVDLSRQSTGLAYPKFYNWPEVVATTLDQDDDIKVMVVYMGANDPWDFPVPGRKQYLRFKSADWERAYRARIQQILLSAVQHQLPVIWLGAPCMRQEKLHRDMVYLNTLYQSEVIKFNGTYIPTSDLLGCHDEQYSAYVETETGNLKVRTNDGIHFTPTGQRRVAERIVSALKIKSEAIETPLQSGTNHDNRE